MHALPLTSLPDHDSIWFMPLPEAEPAASPTLTLEDDDAGAGEDHDDDDDESTMLRDSLDEVVVTPRASLVSLLSKTVILLLVVTSDDELCSWPSLEIHAVRLLVASTTLMFDPEVLVVFLLHGLLLLPPVRPRRLSMRACLSPLLGCRSWTALPLPANASDAAARRMVERRKKERMMPALSVKRG